ncbi:MAG: glycosyltransferase [Deltaproteobacteria bacterium]|nr:glycosyltransferase [Deltaproteobacteria bacterium]
MRFLKRLFYRKPEFIYKPDNMSILIIGSNKKNQGYYRDLELLRQTCGVKTGEDFDYESYDWDIRRVINDIFGSTPPQIIYIHYVRHYTHRIKNLDKTGIPIIGFVGDPQDFIIDNPVNQQKKEFFVKNNVTTYFTIAPKANEMVYEGLGTKSIRIINSHLAADPNIFKPMGMKRKYDIASMGAHTDKKYPFRRLVREHLESQKDLKFYKRQRVKGHSNDAERFAKLLNRFKSCFTCASIYGYTVAKYYEIPACGTLLFGEKTDLLDEFGYIDGINFVEVTPENFKDKFHYYLREVKSEERESIAEAGRRLVLSRHIWEHRIREVVKEIKEIVGG